MAMPELEGGRTFYNLFLRKSYFKICIDFWDKQHVIEFSDIKKKLFLEARFKRKIVVNCRERIYSVLFTLYSHLDLHSLHHIAYIQRYIFHIWKFHTHLLPLRWRPPRWPQSDRPA